MAANKKSDTNQGPLFGIIRPRNDRFPNGDPATDSRFKVKPGNEHKVTQPQWKTIDGHDQRHISAPQRDYIVQLENSFRQDMGILIADTNLLFSDPVDYQSKWALRTERTWEIANELATLYGPDELAVEGLRGLDVVERKNLDPFYQAEGNTILTVLMKEPMYTELGIHPKSQEHEISSHNNFFGEVDKGALELILCGVAEKVCEEWHCNYDMSGQDDKELVFEMYWDAIPGEDFERMIARLELQESDGEDGKEYSILAVGLPLKQYLNEVMAEDQIHFLMPETKRHSKDKPDYHNHVLTQTGVQAAYESRGCSPNCGPETHIPRPRPHRG